LPVASKDSILIVAAEPSSCLYANLLMDQWAANNCDIQIFGVGDLEMERKGMERIGHSEDMAVMGFFEVIKHIRPIKKVFHGLLEQAAKVQPKAALLLDYPGFNLRLAEKLKGLGIPVYYYISPQIWAWKKNRIQKIKKFIDEMYVVLPFEEGFYQKHGVQARFVGHPLLEVMEIQRQGRSEVLPEFTLGIMPGSRKSEIKKNLPVQLKAAAVLAKKSGKTVSVSLIKAPSIDEKWLRSEFSQFLDGSDMSLQILHGNATDMILRNEVLLVASGTATLQVALCGRPMVAMYKMNSATAWLAKRLVQQIDYFCLVKSIHQILGTNSATDQVYSSLKAKMETLCLNS